MEKKGLSRRKFLTVGAAAVGSTLVAAACRPRPTPEAQAPSPTSKPLMEPTLLPTKIVSPTETTSVYQENIFLTQEEREQAKVEFVKAYEDWKKRYVTSEGTLGSGQLRVRRPEYFEDVRFLKGLVMG